MSLIDKNYTDSEENKLTEKEQIIIKNFFSKDPGCNYEDLLDENDDLDSIEAISENRKNIISWYPFTREDTLLELNGDYGTLTMEYCDRLGKVVTVEPKLEKARIIDFRTKCFNNIDVYAQNIEDFSTNEKFDFVSVIVNIDSKDMLDKYITVAKKFLKDTGKILLTIDNKFAVKYWAGAKGSNIDQYETLLDQKGLSLNNIKECLDGENLKYKFFYPIPNYKFANAIFTDNYLPNEENILSRDLYHFDYKVETMNFPEREVLKEVVNNNKEMFKFFANSYLLEISKEEIESDIKFITFGLLRKYVFRIRTIVHDTYVEKQANNALANDHIDRIAYNIDLLKRLDINSIEKKVDNSIRSDFIEGETLDKIIVRLFKEGKTEEAYKLIHRFEDEILNKFKLTKKEIIKSDDFENIFERFDIDIPLEILKKCHTVDEALVDLIFQNIFMIDDKLTPYDQEWLELFVPREFILYRALSYLPNIRNITNIDKLYEEFGLTEFIPYFEKLDKEFQEVLRNEIFWNLHVNSYNSIKQNNKDEEIKRVAKENIKSLESILSEKEHYIKRLESDIKENQELIVSYEKQITDYNNSLSVKIHKAFKTLFWFFNKENNGKTFIQRLLPPGGRRRQEYDLKLGKKIQAKKEEGFHKATDDETVEFWKGIEHRYQIKAKRDIEREKKGEWQNYEYYLRENLPNEDELDIQRKTKFRKKPKISIVIPLYNTPTDFFRELYYNIYMQTYPNWELCLADGSKEPLKEIENMCKDPRVKYKFLNENKGISGNTNEGIKMATGDFIALLDHDDLLYPNALFELVKSYNEHPNGRFFYTDEDKIKVIDDIRFDAFFKPDFSIDYLRGNNYICHFSAFKKEVMDKLEGERNEYNGAQDLDIFLRMTEIVDAKDIIHIPKVVYSWRISETSTAGDPTTKLYAYESGRKAVEDHIHRMGLKGTVINAEGMYGIYRVKYDIEENAKANIIVYGYENKENLEKCINSILKQNFKNYDISVIYEKSDESSKEYIKHIEKKDNITVFKNLASNELIAKINEVASKVHSDYLVFLNGNIELEEETSLEDLVGYSQRDDVAFVGGKVYNPDGKIVFAGYVVSSDRFTAINRGLDSETFGYFARERHIQDMSAVSAKIMCVKKSLFEELGCFDESLGLAADVDICLKAFNKGYLNIYQPFASGISYETVIKEADDELKNKVVTKNNVTYDKYFNVNFEENKNRYIIKKCKV